MSVCSGAGWKVVQEYENCLRYPYLFMSVLKSFKYKNYLVILKPEILRIMGQWSLTPPM